MSRRRDSPGARPRMYIADGSGNIARNLGTGSSCQTSAHSAPSHLPEHSALHIRARVAKRLGPRDKCLISAKRAQGPLLIAACKRWLALTARTGMVIRDTAEPESAGRASWVILGSPRPVADLNGVGQEFHCHLVRLGTHCQEMPRQCCRLRIFLLPHNETQVWASSLLESFSMSWYSWSSCSSTLMAQICLRISNGRYWNLGKWLDRVCNAIADLERRNEGLYEFIQRRYTLETRTGARIVWNKAIRSGSLAETRGWMGWMAA